MAVWGLSCSVLRGCYVCLMGSLTVKLPDPWLVELRREAQTQGVTVSSLVRGRLEVDPSPRAGAHLEDLERRVSRLEEIAGL